MRALIEMYMVADSEEDVQDFGAVLDGYPFYQEIEG